MAAFIARWNLRGVGVAESEIDDAIAYADQAFGVAGGPTPAPNATSLPAGTWDGT